jgi:hypothetical protein
LRKSLLLVSQAWRICFVELRARSSVAAAVETDGSAADALLRAAEADARALERGHAPWATALAGLLRAAVAATRARREAAAARLVQVETELDALDMKLRAAVAKRRRGQVLGGEEGAELVRQADAVMADQDIQNPTRWAAMQAPGRWVQ